MHQVELHGGLPPVLTRVNLLLTESEDHGRREEVQAIKTNQRLHPDVQ